MAGPVTIDWGDGTPKQDGPETGTVTHKYADGVTGEQTITVCSKADPTKCTKSKFTPGGGTPATELKVTAVEATTDTTRMTVKATVDNTGQGAVKVDWGDGSTPVDGPEKSDLTYKYPRAGQFTITATDADVPTRKGTATVTVPFGPVSEPKATAEADATNPRTAKVTWSGFPQGTDDTTVSVDWGDGTPKTTGQPAEGSATHTYADTVTTEQTITVVSETDATKKATATFTPSGGTTPTPGTPKVTAAADTTDTAGRTVKASYDGFPTGKVSVDWGDGTPKTEADGPKGDQSHKYADTVKGEQTITVTSVADATKKATATFTPKDSTTPPEPTGDPKLTVTKDATDTTNMTALAVVDYAGKPVSVDFGEGEPVDNPGDGKTTSKFVYTAPGNYTVTAADKADTSKTDTVQVQIPFEGDTPAPAAPKLSAAADTTDTAGRTVKASFEGFPTGKVSVDFGDKTTAVQADGPKGELSHKYADAVTGEQTITATSVADATKTATAKFTPKAATPAPAAPKVTAAADTTDTAGRTVKASYDGFPEGKITADFGDKTTAVKVDGTKGTVSHKYAAGVSGEQTITFTSDVDATKKATAKFTPKAATARRYRD